MSTHTKRLLDTYKYCEMYKTLYIEPFSYSNFSMFHQIQKIHTSLKLCAIFSNLIGFKSTVKSNQALFIIHVSYLYLLQWLRPG